MCIIKYWCVCGQYLIVAIDKETKTSKKCAQTNNLVIHTICFTKVSIYLLVLCMLQNTNLFRHSKYTLELNTFAVHLSNFSVI